MSLTIRYSSSFDQSGYGVAARDMAYALISSGLNVSTNTIYTPMSRQEVAGCAALDEISKRQSSKQAQVNICEQVPILWNYGFQKGSKNIGRMYWEADKLPTDWVNIINNGLCDEVWASCQWNKDVYINSGVKKPIYVIPPIINTEHKIHDESLLPIPYKDYYKFYSIFQWTPRKNPEALLRAYFNEFSNDENVLLVVKAYGAGASLGEQRSIKETIVELKKQSSNKNPAPVFYIGELIKPEQVELIHQQCQCYVSTSRAEGWNVPLTDAIGYNNQVITTQIGGITEHLNNTNAYIIPNTWENVAGMPFGNIYNSNMKWGSVDVADVQTMMRKAYNERKDYAARSNQYADILKVGSVENVLKLVKERLGL